MIGGEQPDRDFGSSTFAVLVRNIDWPRRNNGGNGMLVYHLRHGVLEQDDILVKRLDLTLQFDAVHKIDGYRNMLPAQRVEERVL